MTDTEGLEAMKARHREELAEWRTRCERAEADNAALVERAQHVLADDSDEAWTALAECVAQPHPGDALRERLLKAEQEAERLTTATSTLDSLRQLAENELASFRAYLPTVREEGRREGLEQAAAVCDRIATRTEAAAGYGTPRGVGLRSAVDEILALAAQPTQKAPHEDEPPDTAALFAAVREALEASRLYINGPEGARTHDLCDRELPGALHALSALERRMGAMARTVRALHEALLTFLPEERREWSFLYHKSWCACLSDEETDCSCKGTEQGRLVNEALKAFRDANAPLVFTLEEVERAVRDVFDGTNVHPGNASTLIAERLRKRAGGTP